MDTSATRRQKRNTKQDTNACIKRLEDLPDEILQHLLSFLPTKCAVGTSTLSKRWENLWTKLPNLDFHEGSPAKRQQFMNFTERVLIRCDNFHIAKFSLSCSVLSDTSRINAWITAGVMRNAQDFDICLSDVPETWVLPRCLFRCITMKTLKLTFPNILKLPSESCLPNLKILTLENVTFSDKLSNNLLFSGSVLEELTLKRVTFSRDCGGHFTFYGPELAKLVIDNCDLMNICRITITTPKLWKLSLHDYSENEIGEHIKPILGIEAPTLRVIHFCGFGQVCYMQTFQSSLVMASIDIPSFCKESRLVANNVVNFFQRFAFVQQMKISSSVIEVLAYASNVLDKMPNLYITFLEFGPEPAELKSNPVKKILQKCRYLEHIINADDIVSVMQEEDAFRF